VATADAERSRAFYADVLGLPLRSDEPFALVFEVKGTLLRIQKTDAVTPPPYTVLGWQVEDLAQVAHHLDARGVRFERFPGLEQDGLGIWRSPSGAQVAWFKDPDGNILSLTQF
jgi:catechol 2,3-dioxygenase-like lactoylglutathione lyase family enzyme